MNQVMMIGRLGADPEYKTYESSGEQRGVVTFNLAVPRPFTKDETDWFRCVMFGKRAETIANYFSKGSRIGLTGYIRTRTYENRSGDNATFTEIVVSDFDFMDSGNRNSNADKPARPAAPPKKSSSNKYNDDEVFGAGGDDDDDDWE